MVIVSVSDSTLSNVNFTVFAAACFLIPANSFQVFQVLKLLSEYLIFQTLAFEISWINPKKL